MVSVKGSGCQQQQKRTFQAAHAAMRSSSAQASAATHAFEPVKQTRLGNNHPKNKSKSKRQCLYQLPKQQCNGALGIQGRRRVDLSETGKVGTMKNSTIRENLMKLNTNLWQSSIKLHSPAKIDSRSRFASNACEGNVANMSIAARRVAGNGAARSGTRGAHISAAARAP